MAPAGIRAWFGLGRIQPLSFAQSVSYGGLIDAIRSASFVVLMATDIQEGGFLVVGAIFGVSPPIALALLLLRRARDLLLGVAALLVWYAFEIHG